VAASPGKPNEDWAIATPELIVVLDGQTARTDTGCAHGVAWYTERLGACFLVRAGDHTRDLVAALRDAIADVATLHPECDLTHPGTPSAGLAALRSTGQYLVLGDVTIVAEAEQDPCVITDPRVEMTARAERAEADRHPIGTAEKTAAMVAMKHVELAARNMPDGYWIAAADPEAAHHALTGVLPAVEGRRVMLMTDGSARAVTFGLLSWVEVLTVAHTMGPQEILRRVRECEAGDPLGRAWPRNKASDDATLVVATLPNGSAS
jgi:hypothetical protein